MQLRLWGFRLSPFAGRVRATLAEKGIDGVELVDIHPAKRPARLRELNPNNRVPVLEVDGHALRESANICDWIEETFPDSPLLPADATGRAHARGLSLWLASELVSPFFLGMNRTAFGLREGDAPDVVERSFAQVPRRWPQLEQALARADGPWLLGANLTQADLSALALAVRLPEWRVDLAPDAGEYPRTAAWLDALRARPSAAAIDARGTPAHELGYD